MNPFEEVLVYIAAGNYERHEVCGYPDTGKLFTRNLRLIGRMESKEYMEDEPDPPLIFARHQQLKE